MLVNKYVLDPSHIAPSRSDANSNGHFPLPANHHLNTGTPRGFTLQNMNVNMTGFAQNGMMPLQNMPAFMPGMPNFNTDSTNGGGHSAGPIRRGGGRFNNNRSNPYDRSGRNMSRGLNTMTGMVRGGMGMNMGFIAQGGGGQGGKWGDGAGGGMNAMGPREAVQGRSIKSYEDLDAQPGGGGGAGAAAAAGAGAELDY